jgi:hypothetical protein
MSKSKYGPVAKAAKSRKGQAAVGAAAGAVIGGMVGGPGGAVGGAIAGGAAKVLEHDIHVGKMMGKANAISRRHQMAKANNKTG